MRGVGRGFRVVVLAAVWACLAACQTQASEPVLLEVYQPLGLEGGVRIVRTPYLVYTNNGDVYRLISRTCDSNTVNTPWGNQNGNLLHDARIEVRCQAVRKYPAAGDTLSVELDMRQIPPEIADTYTVEAIGRGAVDCVLYNAGATYPMPGLVKVTVLGPPEIRKLSRKYRVANYRNGPPR